MSNYCYGSVLEAQNDGYPPNDGIDEGDLIVRAGKHEADSIEYMTEDDEIEVISFESVGIYEADEPMSEREAQEFAKDQWFKENDADE